MALEPTESGDGLGSHFPFLSLPPELMLRVCDYIDSGTVINVLGQVCSYLHQLVNEDWIWRARIRKRWPLEDYPPTDIPDGFKWKEACMSREAEYTLWTNSETKLQKTNLPVSHSCVDAVHINPHHDLLVVGARDRILVAHKIKDIPTELELSAAQLKSSEAFQHAEAHKGWIWSINSTKDIICTGGWDSKLAIWDINGDPISSYKFKSPVICSAMEGGEILAGTMGKNLIKVDPRIPSPVLTKDVAKKAILCMYLTPRWLITGHESRMLFIFDRQTLTLCNVGACPNGYPKCMDLINNVLYVGCRDGSLYLYEFDHQLGKLTFISTPQEGDERLMEVRSVQATLGSVITANKDGTCKIWEPCKVPALVTELDLGSEICDMVYVRNNLAVGLVSGVVSLYQPM